MCGQIPEASQATCTLRTSLDLSHSIALTQLKLANGFCGPYVCRGTCAHCGGADVGTGSIKVKEGVLGSQWVPPWCRAKAGRSWQCQQKTWESAIVTPGEFLFFFSDMGTFLKSNYCSCF